jgi:predicted translin family RNA/ssDNA-binding protein
MRDDLLFLKEGASAEEARQKLRKLAQQVLTLQGELPEIADLATAIEEKLAGIQAEFDEIMALVDQLTAKCEKWSQDLGNRYTFLVNLKTWLRTQNGEETADDPGGPMETAA